MEFSERLNRIKEGAVDIYFIGKCAVAEVISDIDKYFADRLNGPEDD